MIPGANPHELESSLGSAEMAQVGGKTLDDALLIICIAFRLV